MSAILCPRYTLLAIPLRIWTRPQLSLAHRRLYSTTNNAETHSNHAWLYVDNVFPIQLARWDLRYYLGLLRSDTLLSTIQSTLESAAVHDFRILSVEPEQKDGGVFIKFSYNVPSDSPDSDHRRTLSEIEHSLKQMSAKLGGLPSWTGIHSADVWLVRGTPWREDMDRFPSPLLKIAFEGPDLQEQSLYDILRPYGRIRDLTPPVPVPAGTLRSFTVSFKHIRSATIARNAVHGLDFSSTNKDGIHVTRLRATYQKPIQVHVVRDWMSSHPKIMLPLLVFLLGTLTYTIFDPIRAFMVEGKLLDWFNYKKYWLYQWIRSNALERFSLDFSSKESESAPPETVWKERKDAEAAMRAYLTDMPSTVAFVHGPQGSGKTRMLKAVLGEFDRNALYIDCRELNKATSDSQLVAALASQTGYWPVFTFLNSVNSLIDLASVGLIGQKSGMSSSLTDQLQQILNVVATGLKGVSSSHRADIEKQVRLNEELDARRIDEERKRNRIRDGTWHDGRLDCVAGNGIMSELGIGDEVIEPSDMLTIVDTAEDKDDREKRQREREAGRRQKTRQDMEAVNSMPIVVIRNYAAKVGGSKEELLTVLAQWAAMLAENQIAHVIVLSDNRENAKRLAKALPSKPLNSIALSDADAASSLYFVKQKLHDAGIDLSYSSDQITYVERLGGRASDLESLIHKVQNGLNIKEAVEDIINRAVGELRKNAFGDDTDDAKALPWAREQAWIILKHLSMKSEVPYHDILVDFPFKGDETALRNMEHAELISIVMKDGRPSSIKPGKPVFKWVFGKLVNDKVFQATQDIAMNDKIIASAENTIKSCEEELRLLKDTAAVEPRAWYDGIIGRKSACRERAKYLSEKMMGAEKKIEGLERRNKELKQVLAKGE